MAEEREVWRPLGVDTYEQIAEYNALHEDIPQWMAREFWDWMWFAVQRPGPGPGLSREVNWQMISRMGQALRQPMPNMKDWSRHNVETILHRLDDRTVLQVADYLLAYGADTYGDLGGTLEGILSRCNSAWTVGTRAGKRGLIRRVPEGVQVAADSVMGGTGRAGLRLARAWEELYGLNPDPSKAYSLAIKAVEDASVKLVCPKNAVPTLGAVIRDMENQKNWRLPMDQEHPKALSKEVVLGMLRVLWCGQHDRHGGGEPEKPGDVSQEEATVAVLLAVTLVGWFDAGLVARRT